MSPTTPSTVNPLIAPVQSEFEQQVQVLAVEQDKLTDARAIVNKKIAFAKRQLSGVLTRAEFDALPRNAKLGYRRAFGVPKTQQENQAVVAAASKRARRNKLASKSRKRNSR